ncbi:alpha/beta hydrolase family protein [Streptomyces sp. NPDC057638]|uniref:alpha/beta hydrolase family protein n=1 Tax=Streptomyces sp. NPDC057638 TaxID=3346190 RepID=UPI0036AEA115
MARLLRIRAAAAAVLALSLALPLTATGTAAASSSGGPPVSTAGTAPTTTVPQLPRPTGAYPVGTTSFDLVDRSRRDPWVPSADGRELVVSLHYPASRPSLAPPARYATTEEVRLLVQGVGFGDAVPPERLAAMRVHARTPARPAPGTYPLVVLSPGFGVSRYTLTHLAEDLASRGYVVASVDHAYESFGTAVGNRMLTCVACDLVDSGAMPTGVVTATRARDVSYVLDRLTGRHPVWRHAGMIDARRIGMAGHSIGGASAATAMAADRRVDAGVNMDGAFWEPLPPTGLDGRPFMLLGTDDAVHRPGGTDRSWDATWAGLDGWKRWLTVAGSEHFSFSDGPLIQHHFGLPRPPIPAHRAVAVTRAYLAAFFDRHLRGTPQPLLDGPSAAHPEVVFHHR